MSDRLCREYGLSVIEKPKKAPSRPLYLDEKSGKPTSPLMKEELRKLDEITAQVRYMLEHNISTLSDLHADRDRNQAEMDRLTDYLRHLQNKIQRASPAEKETLRAEKIGGTEYTVNAHFRKDGRDSLAMLSDIFIRNILEYGFYDETDGEGDGEE